MDNGNNIIQLFPKDKLDNVQFHQILTEFVGHLKEENDFEKTCQTYLLLATRVWIGKVGYARFKEILFELIVTLDEQDEKGEFD